MVDRGLSEVELREMLEHASHVRPDVVPGRWIVAARHKKKRWEAIVEPDEAGQLLVVVTAYPVVRDVK